VPASSDSVDLPEQPLNLPVFIHDPFADAVYVLLVPDMSTDPSKPCACLNAAMSHIDVTVWNGICLDFQKATRLALFCFITCLAEGLVQNAEEP
jgi:hypothetical protein